jgi:uncharacterized protein YqeY
VSIKEKLKADLVTAMKARAELKVSTLRLVTSAIKNKEIDERKELDDEGVLAVLNTAAKQRRDSIEQYAKGGRQDLVDAETEELAILEGYLPKGMTDAEIEAALAEVIREKGFTSSKDVGLAMKELMARHRGRVDGKQAQAIVRRLLP